MRRKSGTYKDAADKPVRGIKRKTRKDYSAEETMRIVLAGLRGEESIATLCRREGVAELTLENRLLKKACPLSRFANKSSPGSGGWETEE